MKDVNTITAHVKNPRIDNLFVYLGAPNNEHGVLSPIAESRADRTFSLLQEVAISGGYNRVLLTGGFGDQFNTTERPHFEYVEKHLSKRFSMIDEYILDRLQSSNTVDDARLSRGLLDQHKVRELTVVTSDFHIPRASYIFRHFFKDLNVTLNYSGAHADHTPEKLQELEEHEKKSLQSLIENGIY